MPALRTITSSRQDLAGAARQFLRTELAAVLDAGPASADVSEDAALVVSELVTNAVSAGSTIVQVDLTVHRDHLVITSATTRQAGPG